MMLAAVRWTLPLFFALFPTKNQARGKSEQRTMKLALLTARLAVRLFSLPQCQTNAVGCEKPFLTWYLDKLWP